MYGSCSNYYQFVPISYICVPWVFRYFICTSFCPYGGSRVGTPDFTGIYGIIYG